MCQYLYSQPSILGYTYTKKIPFYLKFKFNWMSFLFAKSCNLTTTTAISSITTTSYHFFAALTFVMYS